MRFWPASLQSRLMALLFLALLLANTLTQGRDAELFERSIDLLVSRLRQRLREDAREAGLH